MGCFTQQSYKRKGLAVTQAAASASLKLDGEFYPRFIEKKDYSPEALAAKVIAPRGNEVMKVHKLK